MDSFDVGSEPANIVFHVGPYAYKIVFVRDLRDPDDNEPLWGRCDPNNQIIYLDAEHQDRNIEKTIVHELTHAWDFAVGAPRDAEAVAERNSTIFTSLHMDLAEQGGMAALHRERRRFAATMRVVTMVPGDLIVVAPDDVEQQDAKASPAAARAWCGKCGRIVAGGAIVTQRPRWDRVVGGTVVRRTMYCGSCSHLQSWDEGVYLGAPNGAVTHGPTYVTGPEVWEFLHQHPEANGLAVASSRR